ncbi:MAG: NAD(+)/NADH kinase, partial [Lachnospiraceae bacterium]|nr:NAD(+)/NADH kinase [Lachnospiraceae bacterium]
MKKFYIIANKEKDQELKIANKIIGILTKQNISCKMNSLPLNREASVLRYTDKNDIDSDTDGIIVIGGDGTLLQAARDLADIDIPMIGVNLGHLGYLAEIEQNQI